MEVDIVYTWVDANDPAFQLNIQGYPRPNDEENGVTRYRNNNELLCSLRSVAQYAPWVRTIHIVTDGQCPAWLNVHHPKIRLVTHKDIFLWPEHLPTFNSHAIECHLHRIPGLAEQFIYFNDDQFLGSAVTIDDFFTSAGIPRLSNSSILVNADSGHRWCVINTWLAFAEKFGNDKLFYLASHQAIPLTKTLLQAVEQDWPEMFKVCSANRFRSDNNVELCLALWNNYAYYSGDAQHGTRGWLCCDLTSDHVQTSGVLAHIFEVKPMLFCLFDKVQSNYELVMKELMVFFNAMYPEPSPYEYH